MSVRTKVLALVDVIMRVPPLLVIDEILKISMGLPNSNNGGNNGGIATTPVDSFSSSGLLNENNLDLTNNNENLTSNEHLQISSMSFLDSLAYDPEFYQFLSLTTAKFLICLFGCFSSACIFMLWTRHLVIVYMFIISVGLIFLSYWSNVSALGLIENGSCVLEDILSLNLNRLLDPGGVAISILPHLIMQWVMGLLFAYVHLGPKKKIVQKILPFSFLMPLLLAMLPLPNSFLKPTPAFAAILPFVLTKISLWSSSMDVGKTVYNGYQYARTFATNFGLSALVENEWQRLNVPCVLRAFWSVRICHQLISMLSTAENQLNIFEMIQNLLVSGCETLTAVLGMTSIISIICHYIGKLFQFFLLSEDFDEDKSIGTISAILFYILALQTGLTSLSPEKRFVRLCRNLCLLITALLHFLHNIVSPILMSLSASRNPSRKRHARALIVCAFLLLAPMCLLGVLWSRHSPSTWLLAVTAFSVEVIVKVLVSLATYTLFLLDARRQTFWEKLDDYVYYIRAFGNSVEFCFGIFLFFNGAWILVFESAQNAAGGAIRALMMCIHAYFNIWCEARAGWTVFMKRRTAVHKISSLPEATLNQLQNNDDVCAICYQEMSSAKITRCKHFFHGVCLRKWLYVQDRCPLCHEIMMYMDKTNNDDENNSNPDNGGGPPEQNNLDNDGGVGTNVTGAPLEQNDNEQQNVNNEEFVVVPQQITNSNTSINNGNDITRPSTTPSSPIAIGIQSNVLTLQNLGAVSSYNENFATSTTSSPIAIGSQSNVLTSQNLGTVSSQHEHFATEVE